jgi:hypothetical protein
MNKSDSIFQRHRQAIIKKLCERTDFIEGSLFVRTINGKQRTYLSRIVDGVQRQVYISDKHLQRVQQGVDQYQITKQLIHELSEVNIKTIQQEQ